jgi:hypothetical protein
MKKTLILALLSLTVLGSAITSASADVSSIGIRFAGGCTSSNSTGGCTIKTVASGSYLDLEFFELYVSNGPSAPFHRASAHYSFVDASGVGRSRLRNIPKACFQMRTAPNGNDKPDAHSNVLCEK